MIIIFFYFDNENSSFFNIRVTTLKETPLKRSVGSLSLFSVRVSYQKLKVLILKRNS